MLKTKQQFNKEFEKINNKIEAKIIKGEKTKDEEIKHKAMLDRYNKLFGKKQLFNYKNI